MRSPPAPRTGHLMCSYRWQAEPNQRADDSPSPPGARLSHGTRRCESIGKTVAIPRREPYMPTITVPRSDVTTEQVSEVLRQGLGPRYNVLPGKGMNWNPVGNPRTDHPDKIVVGTRSTRLSAPTWPSPGTPARRTCT